MKTQVDTTKRGKKKPTINYKQIKENLVKIWPKATN
jgi:hypothetical protein